MTNITNIDDYREKKQTAEKGKEVFSDDALDKVIRDIALSPSDVKGCGLPPWWNR